MTTASRTSRGKAPIFSARQASQKRMVLYAQSRRVSRSWMVCMAPPGVKEGKATPRHRVRRTLVASTLGATVAGAGTVAQDGLLTRTAFECVMTPASHCGLPPVRPLTIDEAHH